jgi:hypothetical protein
MLGAGAVLIISPVRKHPKFDFDQIADREAVIIVPRIRKREARP